MRISTSEFFHLLFNVKVRMVIFFSKAKKQHPGGNLFPSRCCSLIGLGLKLCLNHVIIHVQFPLLV